jgi:hypothetical protein
VVSIKLSMVFVPSFHVIMDRVSQTHCKPA